MRKNVILILLLLTPLVIAGQAQPSAPDAVRGGSQPPLPPTLTHNAAVEAALQVKHASVNSSQSSSQPAGVTMVSLEIEVQNNSRQVITAFNYHLRLRFADGRGAPSEGGEDLIKNLAIARNQPEIASPSLTFSPATTRQITRNFAVRAGGAAPVAVDVFPSMVVFEDCTALGNPSEITKIAASRKTEAEYLAGLIADLDGVAASKDPAAALTTRIARLKQEGSVGPNSKQAKDLEGFSDVVGLFGKINNGHDIGREAFKGQLDEIRAQQKMLAEHSSLKRAE
jgi:hypothetical protein